MLKNIYWFIVLLVIYVNSALADDKIIAELDATWAEMSRIVAKGDYKNLQAAYHPDAIFVSGSAKKSYPIETAFKRWQQDFEDTKAGKIIAQVDFRMSERSHDQNTAHETGMYHYFSVDESGKRDDYYVQLEALFVKKSGKWLMMMEFQKSSSTKRQWQLLK
jgi:ketosteroid isomerase-like protein